jgi:hypothetical protein
MHSPSPPDSFRQPPYFHNGSTSSLSDPERPIPSFLEFISRTPPPDSSKPLPPTPLIPRRSSSASPPRSKTPSSFARSRSSSIYSRTVSQWGDGYSWNTADFADEPLPPLPTLQPVAYSSSTPQLGGKSPTAEFPETRTYSPLIITPSPTESRGSTPPPGHGSPIFSPISSGGGKRAPKTISLAQAKAAVHAPGAIHLLPEVSSILKRTHAD